MLKQIITTVTYFLAQLIVIVSSWNVATELNKDQDYELPLFTISLVLIGALLIVLIRRYSLITLIPKHKNKQIKPLQKAFLTLIPIWEIYQHYSNQEQVHKNKSNHKSSPIFLQLCVCLAVSKVFLLLSSFLSPIIFLQLPLLVFGLILDTYLMSQIV
jgi:hypothetical protein